MSAQSAIGHKERPRELRRRVMLRARLRAMSGWCDACILNISSRGLMINAPSALAKQGAMIELWHGDQLIIATVVWRKGSRAGLQTEDKVPIDEILAMSKSGSLQLTASWPDIERRRRRRPLGDARVRARIMEFVSILFIAASLATGAAMMMQQAFARPLHYIEAALRN